jgi:hypothetical protein
MPWKLANPDRLFDRTWRPRHPLRPKLSSGRRWCMLTLLILLSAVILGYTWLTDARRVRGMAGAYLSELLGANVDIRRASLSIFEGLRLDDVTVTVDGGPKPDSTVFHAQTLLIRYNPAELLAGKINATQIIAIDPTVILVEDLDNHKWNYQRLWHGVGHPPRHQSDNTPTVLPQIILRDAQVAYEEMRNAHTQTVGWYSLEGRLSPGDEAETYDFALQSRGRESLGPSVDGTIRTDGGTSVFRLRDLTFGPDIKAMLLSEPRAWCERHQLQGRIDVPEMIYKPGLDGKPPTFRVEIALSSVELAVSPDEWMSRWENNNVSMFHAALDSQFVQSWMSSSWVNALVRLSTPQPIHLRQVSGTLVFTEKGIQLKAVNGRVENNWFNLDGTMDGYTPDGAATITASSLEGHDLEIPAWSPTYAGSLPPEVQEIYERLHPQGTCSVSVTIERKVAGGRPDVTGEVDIHDGQFRFADFPYLLSGATGTILIGPDPLANMDGIRIMNVHGHGPIGSANANAAIAIDGFIGPMDQVAGVWLDVRASNITSEPALRAALPTSVDSALRLFDPAGTGDLPHFHGRVLCRIVRPIGRHKRWDINTDIDLDDVEGTLVFFPYPMKHLSGRLEIHDGWMNIIGAKSHWGNSSLAINGAVTWKTGLTRASTRPFGPDLQVVATNIPVDDDLKNALPAQERDWLVKSGATGRLDAVGHVFPIRLERGNGEFDSGVDYTFDAKLTGGGLWPGGAGAVLSDATADLHLTSTQLEMKNIAAHHGDGKISGSALFAWGGDTPRFEISCIAAKFPLDDAIYPLLPSGAQDAWKELHPKGIVNAILSFKTALNPPSPGAEDSASASAPQDFNLHIEPQHLTITPNVFPYRLDNVSGSMNVTPHQVLLQDFHAEHGPARLAFSGTGALGEHPVWDLKLSAGGMPVDDELKRAAPDMVAQIIKSLDMTGDVDIDFSKLSYRPADQPDMDFAARLTLHKAKVNVGIDVSDLNGTIDMAALVRQSKVTRLEAQISADSLSMAGASGGNFGMTLAKSSDDSIVDISHLTGNFAGGELQGQGQYNYGGDGPGRYDFSLVLHDADVRQLAGPAHKEFNGRLTASLDLDGAMGDPNNRRGHGDVHVYGEDMYNLPIMMGLLQITNLMLPLSSPFAEASVRYTIDGQTIGFDQIMLKSKQMTMNGSGTLDFAAKRVSLWFVTDNPALVNIPAVGPLISGAKEELMKIHVSGTIQQPKVTASTFNTITTTVDQVLTGADK